MTTPLAIEIADYLAALTAAQPVPVLDTHPKRIEAAEAIIHIITRAQTTDTATAHRILRLLRAFADDYANDPLNDDPDCWAGSAADHAEQLYDILEAAGLKP